MTLLESMVALLIVGFSTTGLLSAIREGSHAAHDARQWVTAVEYAHSAMEATKLGTAVMGSRSLPGGYSEQVLTSSFEGASNLQRVTVRVTLPDGRAYVLERVDKP